MKSSFLKCICSAESQSWIQLQEKTLYSSSTQEYRLSNRIPFSDASFFKRTGNNSKIRFETSVTLNDLLESLVAIPVIRSNWSNFEIMELFSSCRTLLGFDIHTVLLWKFAHRFALHRFTYSFYFTCPHFVEVLMRMKVFQSSLGIDAFIIKFSSYYSQYENHCCKFLMNQFIVILRSIKTFP